MKVVLFCGGYGLRMRRGPADSIPKPLQPIGNQPLIWHLMRYYSFFGHTEFILCLGYGAEYFRRVFLEYSRSAQLDCVQHDDTFRITGTDLDWTVTFADTGEGSAIGERLRRVQSFVDGEPHFLANYADVLSDAPLDAIADVLLDSDGVASMLLVAPKATFHCVEADEYSRVTRICHVGTLPLWVNGGFFALTNEIFDVLTEGCDLVEDACVQLAAEGRLYSYKHLGFWQSADTPKEQHELDELYYRGYRPWMPWEDRVIDGSHK
jgi:glucose-1-phosphate cytidylyltransferase